MNLCPGPSADSEESVRSRFLGALLGTFAGDALGGPLEGLPPDHIFRRHGLVRELLESRLGRGAYTDDTQMTIAVCESLVRRRGFDGEHMAARFLSSYDPGRGYGRGTREALSRLAAGASWTEAGAHIFGNGSFGNGAAMRVAPIGALYHENLPTVAEIARLSATITHSHPLGRCGAALQALGVALALRWGLGGRETMTPHGFLQRLQGYIEDQEGLFLETLDNILLLLRRHLEPPSSPDAAQSWAVETAEVLGNDSRAFRSVPAALYAFLTYRESFEEAVVAAVSLGGDTDTIGAMTGALAGAHLGAEAIPQRWLDGLENSPRGRDYLAGLADDLYLLWLEQQPV